MTKEAIRKSIEEAIIRNGFTFTYTGYGWMPMVPQGNEDYAGITFMSSLDFDQDAGMLIERIGCQARVCRCNPMATAEELMEASGQITRAANLMKEINAMNMSIETSINAKEAE